MSTLLLRLAAPLQSWGVASKFDTRDTAREPTKSGVIGLLAAALGRSRTDNLDDLKELYFGVRIDQPGLLLRDYHTAKQKKSGTSFVTTRYYLADAVFLVGLEGEENFLQKLAVALKNPVFPLYLGKRSCPPVGQLVLGLRARSLRQALEEELWQASEWYQNELKKKQLDKIKLTIVCDAKPNETGAFLRRDLPISFSQQYRQYGFRMVIDSVDAVSIPTPLLTAELPTEHDAMAGWGD
ncbi:MAG: type I-E CRISPR-associated protein Cas5/CasD [Pelotomaculum sp.]|jgi:CRISPR system Cascade subunit CasD